MSYIYSVFQKAIFNFLLHGMGNAVISAVAGSGKTTTIQECLTLIPSDKSVLYMAFNVETVNKVKIKYVSNTNIKFKTSHGIGYAALLKHDSSIELDEYKYSKMIRNIHHYILEGKSNKIKEYGFTPEILRDLQEFRADSELPDYDSLENFQDRIKSLCSLARGMLVYNCEELEMIARTYDIDYSNGECRIALLLVSLGEYYSSKVDYTDMIYFPNRFNLKTDQYDFVFVDECQDLNKAQRLLMLKSLKPNGRFIAVGDPCQPEGTTVQVVIKKADRWNKAIIIDKKIEDLTLEDKVVSADFRSSSFVYGRKILGITKKEYQGDLIKVDLPSGKSSKYTINHHCVADFKSVSHKYAVYMMKRGDNFRVGRSKLDYGNTGSGVSVRARTEKAESFWILDVYDTKEECALMEKAISGKFGIPEITFEPSYSSSDRIIFNKEFLDKAWKYLSDTHLMERAERCLTEFGRDIRYPFFSLDNKKQKTFKRPIVVHACNLLDGCLMLPFNKQNGSHYKKTQWEQIKIKREKYSGFVYSLSVEKESLYVADNILTHNCQAIYGFAGADFISFKQFVKIPNTIELPLSVCYRCDSEIIDLAKTLVPHIEFFDKNAKGVVDNEAKKENIKSGDMVLCRTNYPLIKMCLDYLKVGVKAHVRGRDIGKNIVDILKKSKTEDLSALFSYVYTDLEKIKKRVQDKHGLSFSEAQEHPTYVAYKEKIEIIELLSAEAKTVNDIVLKIEQIFSDDNDDGIQLSTIHKAKGLESDNVFIIHRELLGSMYSGPNSQEDNIMYVAYTRAKHYLGFVIDFSAYKDKKQHDKSGEAKIIPKSNFVGTLNEKMFIDLTLRNTVVSQDGKYTIYKFVDEFGNIFSKFAPVPEEFLSGKTFRCCIKITKHNEFKGVKDNTVSYMETEADAKARDEEVERKRISKLTLKKKEKKPKF